MFARIGVTSFTGHYWFPLHFLPMAPQKLKGLPFFHINQVLGLVLSNDDARPIYFPRKISHCAVHHTQTYCVICSNRSVGGISFIIHSNRSAFFHVSDAVYMMLQHCVPEQPRHIFYLLRSFLRVGLLCRLNSRWWWTQRTQSTL